MPFQPGNKLSPVLWKPGQSGNPGGRSNLKRRLEALAKQNGRRAIKRILELMDGQAWTYTRRGLKVPVPVSPQTQLAAAMCVLERGFGKAIQTIKSDGDAPVTLQTIERVIVQLDGSDELRIDAEPVPKHNGYEQ